MTKTPYSPQSQQPTPNVWFKVDVEDMGEIEVSAFVPQNQVLTRKDVLIIGVGAPDDVHITPEEAGLGEQQLNQIKLVAIAKSKTKQGEH